MGDNTGLGSGGGAGIIGDLVGHGGLVCLCTVRGTAGHSMYTGLETAGHGGQVSMYTGRDTDALGCSAPWGIILGLGRVVVQVSLGWSVCTLGGILVHRVCTLGWILLGTVGWTVCTVYTFGGVVLVLAWMWAPCWGKVSALVGVLAPGGISLG